MTPVCALAELLPERGVAALVEDHQVALFRIGPDDICAVDHHDPHSGANVLARGLVGSTGGTVYVASPLYKTRFDLRTGACLDNPNLAVHVWESVVIDGWVHVGR